MSHGLLPQLKNEEYCTGCGACIASCPKGAISKKKVSFGAWIPQINEELCVKCGLCERVCSSNFQNDAFGKKAYISYNIDSNMRRASASGGVFSGLATYILDMGGSVFGAEMRFEEGKAVVEHSQIIQIKDLHRILGSKYVQSDCVEAYRQAKKELLKGKLVLFSGCSCQIDGLKKYLGNIDQSNLYTIDLICHGIPGVDFFNDYVAFLQKKYKGKISGFSFRTKERGIINYMITSEIENAGGVVFRIDIIMENKVKKMRKVKIPMRQSGYYRMFLDGESYREACYKCPYASLDKPADITIGDYFEAKDDYPQLFSGEIAINCSDGISCVITHTRKGQQLLDNAKEYLFIKEVDPLVVQASHRNLYKPSSFSWKRKLLLPLYKMFGYLPVDILYHTRNLIVAPAKAIREVLNHINKK